VDSSDNDDLARQHARAVENVLGGCHYCGSPYAEYDASSEATLCFDEPEICAERRLRASEVAVASASLAEEPDRAP
jgi:hypothetical protein